MPEVRRKHERARAGRPSVEDQMMLVAWVDHRRKAQGRTVRQYCATREASFGRLLISPSGEPRIAVIKGEALRRRYNKSRQELGLTERYPGLECEALELHKREAQETLDSIFGGFGG